jgi:hypothetical protein
VLKFIAGAVIGALVVTLLQEPRADERLALAGPEPDDLVGKLKYRLRKAQFAAQEERKAKEEQIYQEYEQRLHQEQPGTGMKGAEVEKKT